MTRVAEHLNQEGFQPPKRAKQFTGSMVAGFLAKGGRSGPRPRALAAAGLLRQDEWLLSDLARQLGRQSEFERFIGCCAEYASAKTLPLREDDLERRRQRSHPTRRQRNDAVAGPTVAQIFRASHVLQHAASGLGRVRVPPQWCSRSRHRLLKPYRHT